MTMHKIATMPINYNDMGEYRLTDHGIEVFDELISNRLPDGITWCGNELLADITSDIEINLDDILSSAYEELVEMDDDSIWED